MGPLFRPPHLLPLRHARTDQLVDRRLGRRAADRQAGSIPGSIWHEVALVRPEVAKQLAHVPDQRRGVLLGHRVYSVQDRLQDCRRTSAAWAMPCHAMPCQTSHLARSRLRSISLHCAGDRRLSIMADICAAPNFMAMWNQSRNPGAGQRAARSSCIKLECTVGDGRDPLARSHTLLREEQIKALCPGGNLARDVAIQAGPSLGQRCAPHDDIELTALQTTMFAVLEPDRIDRHHGHARGCDAGAARRR